MKLQPVSLAPAALTFIPSFCQAAMETSGIPDPLTGLGQMLFGLMLVLGILAAFAWLLKRFSSPVRGSGFLRVLGVTAVGPREKVVLLEVGKKILMLGVTPNNVRTLHVFEHGELPLEPMPAISSTGSGSSTFATSFAGRLAQALKGRRNAS
ncbi:MAG: flagellar biosynthetic protein FliO [Betaproteobacteria bacterium]|nr:flagellar biosynthetic protein FliO [Betaproteobacteria bacterium]